MEKKATFDMVRRTRQATVEGVDGGVRSEWATVRFRYSPGQEMGGVTTGAAMVGRVSWPGHYWPPAVGDVVRVVDGPAVMLEVRPRRPATTPPGRAGD